VAEQQGRAGAWGTVVVVVAPPLLVYAGAAAAAAAAAVGPPGAGRGVMMIPAEALREWLVGKGCARGMDGGRRCLSMKLGVACSLCLCM